MTYPIPDIALDDRLGWIGTSGSGKTYNAGGTVERLLALGSRVVIIDPLGVWWGLRLNADGSPSRFSIPIFGGDHGDLPLSPSAGKLIGETVASMAESCIIDLSGMRTKEEERQFMLSFLENWYRNTSGELVHAVFDEADLWAPQGTGTGSGPKLQSLMEQIVRRGRVRGFVPQLITQRSAVISKDVLSQVDGLVIFKLTSSNDRKAIGEWVKSQADLDLWNEIWGKLPAMQRGQGVVWIPARGILETVTFPRKLTFDSSSAPERGKHVEKRELKPLDLDKLKSKLAAIEDEAKANDPKELRAQVQRLTRELAKAEKAKVAPQPQPEIVHANGDEIDAARQQGFQEGLDAAIENLAQLAGTKAPQPSRRAVERPAAPLVERSPAPTGGPGQRILNSLAWWEVLGHRDPLNEQVAFIAGYSHTSSGYTNPRGALKSSGLIDYPAPGRVALTDAGRAQAEAPGAPPTGEELRHRVLGKLAGPQQRILSVLIEAHPDQLTNAECASRAGYSPTSSGYTNPRGNLKTLNLIDYPSSGQCRASDWLFP